MYETQPQNTEPDIGLLRKIRSIAAINTVIGAAELVAGVATNSSTLTMAGVHDLSDGGLYEIKHQAAKECDGLRKRRLRRLGASTLIGAALTIGSYEIASAMTEDHQPKPVSALVGIVAAGANIGAAGIMHSKRHSHDAHDTWRHVVGVDVPASMVTLVVTPLSVRYPELDILGATAHMALATRVGLQTLQAINSQPAET